MQIKLGFSLQNKGRLKNLIMDRVPQKTAKNMMIKGGKEKEEEFILFELDEQMEETAAFSAFHPKQTVFIPCRWGRGGGTSAAQRVGG